ncbi:hypothetical protein PENSPDRAFT_570139 [Peniophora sp. CONT]|nr:hypothetical protein PENSPDRAFT_570139 [Peniophora sp. CONT]
MIASKLLPEHKAAQSALLSILGVWLRTHFERHGELDDLQQSVVVLRLADRVTPAGHIEKPARLFNLGTSLWTRFQHLGEREDLERASAIAVQRLALHHTLDSGTEKSELLANLAISLLDRFHMSGELEDLEGAVTLDHNALELTPDGHPEKPARLNALGISLADRYRRLGKLDDIERSITVIRRSLELTPEGHSGRLIRLHSLGVSLTDRFQLIGERDDIECAITAHELSVELTPKRHPDRPVRLHALATSLSIRFQHLDILDDLERAIITGQQAVEFTPERHLEKPVRLDNLGIFLTDRFRRLGERNDLERAIAAKRSAVELTSECSPDKPARLSSLAESLSTRYQSQGALQDIEDAVIAGQRAVDLTPEGHPRKPSRLHGLAASLNLAASLTDRYDALNSLCDIERAVSTVEQAVELTPEGHQDRPARLHDLCASLVIRFQCTGKLDDLERAIMLMGQAIELTPEGHPDRPAPHQCVLLLSNYPEFGSAESLLLAHARIIQVFPEIVWLGHSVGRRYEESARLGALVNAAVSAFIKFHSRYQAVEWMETGRSLVWSQILSLREPMDDLMKSHPHLAAILQQISLELRLGNEHLRPTSTGLNDSVASSTDAGSESHRRLVIKYDDILAKVRSLRGFEDFLRSPKVASLMPFIERLTGPVVFINIHSSSSDALALHPNGAIRHVALPALKESRAMKLRTLWAQNLERCNHRMRGTATPAMITLSSSSGVFERILECLWTWVIEPILRDLNVMKDTPSNRLTHITWCPTGPLTQLPLHAAGLYSERRKHRPHVFDFVVSSYTPSLSALLRCHRQRGAQSSQPNILVVAQPETPGWTHLPGAQNECERLRAVMPHHAQTFLVHEQGTVASVLDAMSENHWMHIACHGMQDTTDPTQSAFALYDGQLTLSALMETVADNAELAFLSACQTAVGDEKIPEESAHLAAGMLAVGFKGVIATMWSIGDADAPIIVEAYYKKLLELRSSGDVAPGYTGAAYALHEAAKVLREHVGERNFVKWAPFVHLGV